MFWSEQPRHVMHCKSVRETMSKHQSPISEETSDRGSENVQPHCDFSKRTRVLVAGSSAVEALMSSIVL